MSLLSPTPPVLNGPALIKPALNEVLSKPALSQRVLSHLDRLEAESIHILREVAAGFRNPVMMYSVGKDSSVLLHLLGKAFAPGRPPIPLLHVDTGWKFREMIAFRDRRAAETGVTLHVHTNPEGVAQGIGPISHGATVHTDVMKTQALKQALDKFGFDAAIGGARRDEEKSRAKEQGRIRPRLPDLELDRARHLALHLSREDPRAFVVFRRGATGGGARWRPDPGR